MSGIDLADSVIYGHLWATDETRALLDDAGRTRAGCEIIAALAAAQGELGMIPAPRPRELDAPSRRRRPRGGRRARRARTGHSTLGLIRVLRRGLGPEARRVDLLRRDRPGRHRHLVRARDAAHARDRAARAGGDRGRAARGSPSEHRDTLMLGRTHGQPGLPITFGFKAAVWAAEVRRHLRAHRRRPSRGSPSASSPARSARCRPGATHGPELQRRAAGAARARRARTRAG